MKSPYSEFVRHCLRFYIKTIDEGKGGCPIFRSEAERNNWSACHHVVQSYSTNDQDLIAHLYRPGDTIPDKIYALSSLKRVSQASLWSFVNKLEREIAKKRGLV